MVIYPHKNNTKQQYMVSGVGDLTYWTSLFLVFTNWEKNRSRTGVTIKCCTKLWPSYCTCSGVRITIPK